MVPALLVMIFSSSSFRSSVVVRSVVLLEFGRVEGCRRVRIGRVEGLILVCLVSVYCVFVSVEFVATASALFFAFFLVGRSTC